MVSLGRLNIKITSISLSLVSNIRIQYSTVRTNIKLKLSQIKSLYLGIKEKDYMNAKLP